MHSIITTQPIIANEPGSPIDEVFCKTDPEKENPIKPSDHISSHIIPYHTPPPCQGSFLSDITGNFQNPLPRESGYQKEI
jgi:hypothetical protein